MAYNNLIVTVSVCIINSKLKTVCKIYIEIFKNGSFPSQTRFIVEKSIDISLISISTDTELCG